MNDAEHEQTIARVTALFNRWADLLCLTHWRREMVWRREAASVEGEDPEKSGVAFSIHPDWRYEFVRVDCFLEGIHEIDDEQLEFLVVHELMHIHLSPMRVRRKSEIAGQLALEELAATLLAKAVISLRDDCVKEQPDGD